MKGLSYTLRSLVGVVPRLSIYTVATVPPAALYVNCIIAVSNGAAGSRCLAVSDGTNWKQVAISASNISAT